MKKTLLIITALLSIGLIGCKKEESLTDQKSIGQDKQILVRGNPGSYDHSISNSKYKSFYEPSFLSPRDNYDNAIVYMKISGAASDKWYMERLGKYVKFWSQKRYFWEKWRALSLNWNYQTGRSDAVVYEIHGYKNQEWELIGYGNPASTNSRKGFRGVLVNRYDGTMLQAEKDKNGTINVFASEIYRGSKYEKEFMNQGYFSSVDSGLLWEIFISSGK